MPIILIVLPVSYIVVVVQRRWILELRAGHAAGARSQDAMTHWGDLFVVNAASQHPK